MKIKDKTITRSK